MVYLFLAFVLVPFVEIALFIQVGDLIGLFPTLALVVLSAVAGILMIRSQGRNALARLRRSFDEMSDPTEPLATGATILVSGILLVVPGFFTDMVGFLLLLPPVRMALLRWLRARMIVTEFRGRQGDQVIDGEYEVVRPQHDPDAPSGWVEGPRRPG